MIPKIIHYCWLSEDAFPESIQRCFDTWNTELKDYEFWLWDTNRFDIESVSWTAEAYKARKFAFAADYIRLFALYNYGGIYLDLDVLVYKNFDDLLSLPYFLGEDFYHCFEPAIIGATKGCDWIRHVMDVYRDRPFVNKDGSFDMYGLPRVFRDRLVDDYSFHLVSSRDDYVYAENCINVFPYDFFNSRDFVGIKHYPNSYCSHNYLGTWMDNQSIWKQAIKRVFPRSALNLFYKALYQKNRDSLCRIQIPF
jgi:hypothetical protein